VGFLKILVINPNTNPNNTRVIAEALTPHKEPGLEIEVVNPETGPEGMEAYYHKLLAGYHIIPMIAQAEKDGYDAVVIAAFNDAAMEAAKELVNIPVVGMMEASLIWPLILAHKILILVSANSAIPRAERALLQIGLPESRYFVRSIGMDVVDIIPPDVDLDTPEGIAAAAEQQIFFNCKKAVEETNAEAIILGCSGFSGLGVKLQKELNTPVIDPIVAALYTAVALVKMGLAQSKRLTYATPPIFKIKE